ncbi:tRNA (adenosine(37)-N6)-threonylcarbamoyltransferase complex dimerization subunit type 1 TsaB [Aquimarina sp. TRL1]|uniref:tRNA (adenosine(37)-N6)-threonylcarbamoyltransferase complex dimerization subunit type 1 TsaB n=1 Tax=Aquimarina sp. (strain TRL1) TaxID=2736252 RepID=UPI00158B8806|nr:tRNA (adenosine(37)-N6)-threonylcarbamoyltransferase complex dimerization subunit type 1 TsaB [Aquimarina sp. TRL1]QKX05173.1 tRNA (adenosine(37)-N6)-threonylcarbamoyltransferase complex dimerization subunit type 1 TsaB [Aquimarina sp. TRL1]
MAYILCIETSTTNCSVAIAKDHQIVAVKEDYSNQYSHAERLHLFIEDVIATASISINALDAIAVSKGPGSYTGLRIGVSAAKGLAYALNIPMISIPTLTSLAKQVQANEGYVVPMLDARRMEVYSAVFSGVSYEEVRTTKAEILTTDSFVSFLEEENQVVFIGNGVAKFKDICTASNATFICDKLPSAREMCQLAYDKYKAKDFEDVAYFEPYYLKDFVAG